MVFDVSVGVEIVRDGGVKKKLAAATSV